MSYDAMTKSIYLAGFDVFRLDARSYGDDLKALCEEHGYEGLFPLDNEVPAHLKGRAKAEWICGMNLRQLRKSNLVMANLNEFRGAGEPDSGTAFELGYASAMDKPIWAYIASNRALRMRVPHLQTDEDLLVCDKGYLVEDFGLPMNLMIACSAQIVTGGPRDCLKALAAFETAYGVRN